MIRWRKGLAACCGGILVASAHAAAVVSEQDYFTEMPEVLSVSRLAQPLDETPGAVTIIDRDMIHRSGARNVVELLRFVPGFITMHYSGAARPVASYHSDYNELMYHLQVFVDGRSIYSPLFVGSANYGMMGVVLEDIERIEVLRGSNSAAYGSDAFLGVVNIVTRHSADTRGGLVAVSFGERNVRDGVARVGWGDDRASARLTLARTGDDGFRGLYDDSRVEQAHFRADWQPTSIDDVIVTAGTVDFRWGVQYTSALLRQRDETRQNSYVRGQWNRQLNSTDELEFAASADEERYLNFYPYARAEGIGHRVALDAQHSLSAAPGLRLVWGTQYRYESVDSRDLFYSHPHQSFDLWQLFGNIEAKPHPDWVVNAGAMIEKHSISGTTTAPRLSVNCHLSPDHTLRIGATTAYEQPTLYGLRADWRGLPWVVQFAAQVHSTGQVRPERINSSEVGYLGRVRSFRLTADVRIFHEKVIDVWGKSGAPLDIINHDPNVQRGWEMQLRWQPIDGTQLLLNHMQLRLMPDATSSSPNDDKRAPNHVSTFAWFQELPGGIDLTVTYMEMGALFNVRLDNPTPAFHQTDIRLAKRFLIGATRAEAALTVRSVDGSHVDYVVRNWPAIVLDRQAFATLRLEF